VRDATAPYVDETLRVFRTARFESGYVGTYRGALKDLRLKLTIAVDRRDHEEIVSDRSHLQVRVEDMTVDAKSSRGELTIRIDGPDLREAEVLLETITFGFDRVR